MALLELDDKVYKIPNKVMKAFEDLCDYIKDLKEENKTLKELNVCVGCNNNPNYKSRIDKALKEIDGYIRLCAEPDLNYLSDILKGEENESN